MQIIEGKRTKNYLSAGDLGQPESEDRLNIRETQNMKYVDDETIFQREKLLFVNKNIDGKSLYRG